MVQDFLVQTERSSAFPELGPVMTSDVAALVDSICAHNWVYRHDYVGCSKVELSNIERLPVGQLRAVTPVGSIEFVERVMQVAYGVKSLSPIGIPAALRKTAYLQRRLAYCSGAAGVHAIMDEWGVDRLFVKSNDHVKWDMTGIYKKSSELPDTQDILLVSECINIKSEWRALIWKDAIVDIKNYNGDAWVVPDKAKVMAMVDDMGASLRAYTLDVAITEANETVLVEVHNFVACGLYGAEPPLGMYSAAYQTELLRASS